MPLTDPQKVEVRRHLGFPVAGIPLISPAGGTLASGNAGYRFLDAYGQLEFRLNNLNVAEEAAVTGQPTGAVAIIGPFVVGGVTFTVVFSGGGLVSPVTISYTSITGDNQSSVVANIASLVNKSAPLTAAGFTAINPYGSGPFSQNLAQPQTSPGAGQTGNAAIPLAQVAFLNVMPGVTSFTLAASSTAAPSFIVTMQGMQMPPSSVVTLTTNPPTKLWGYLPILDWLEGMQGSTSDNLDTAKADTWIPRMDEIEVRAKLYNVWQRKLWIHILGDGAESQGVWGNSGMYSGRMI